MLHEEIFKKNKEKLKGKIKKYTPCAYGASESESAALRVCFIIRRAAQYKTLLSYRGVFAEMRR